MAEAVNFLLQRLVPVFENEVNLLTGVEAEVVYLKEKLELIKAFLKVADALEESDEELKVWVKQVRDVAHETEDILDELELLVQARNHTNRFFVFLRIRNMKARYRIAHELKNINSRMTTIFSIHKRFLRKLDFASDASNSIYTGKIWHDQRGDALLLDNTDLVGIDRHKNQLIRWLIKGSRGRKVISVTGMGGMGKTTLVKKVYDDPKVIKHFDACAWVTVSQSCAIEELLRDLAQKLFSEIRRKVPKGLESMHRDKLKMIIKKLLQRRKYLVVFDDVWHRHEWEAVRYALPKNNYGSRIMLTTRKSNLANISSKESKGKVYNLQPLKEDEAWDLFCKKTFQGHRCPSYLINICSYILRKCEGLPLAIVAMSGVLATKDKHRIDEWDRICRSLGAEIQINGKLDNLKTVLSLSFNDLPHYLKYCFLYLSMFPEDYLIQRMRLIRLWIAEGFIKAGEGKTMEDIAEDYLKKLINRNLLQVAERTSDGRVKTLRIHDLLREIIILKSKDQNFATIVKEQTVIRAEKIRRLSLQGTLPIPNGQQHISVSQLRSLLMFGVDENLSLGKLFPGGFKLLNVLDYQDSPLKKFPKAVVDLYHLTYLSLRNTQVKTIPNCILGKLQNLETLDLKNTCVTELPTDIVKVKKLRHLLVYQSKVEGYAQFHSKYGFKAPLEIGNLQSLQKLCFVEANKGCRMIIRHLKELSQLRRLGIMRLREEDGKDFCFCIEKLVSLSALSVTSEGENKVIDLTSLSTPPPFLQRLYLSGRLKELPCWIPSLHNLARLFLKWSYLKHDPLVYLQDLPNLAHLELLQVYDGDTLHFKCGKFNKLKVLGIDKFEELGQVIVGKGAMPCLETLSIGRCESLKKVPSGIENLTKIKVLEFFDMPDELMMTICQHGPGKDYWKVSHIPEVYSTYWRDGGWDVYALDSLRDCSPRSGTVRRSHECRNQWKV
ncbi:putative P-loop containing nucleoside triphosphate hydrolase, leucine-rich repeat domain, L [Medicago truncatula]|uniref:Disease resistance protein (CC-NBS-LRR class) family protein n=1 Tax=Medicago truncatula TaxID=3880 RepID=G7K9J1_MEDTR|nr:disease resistance protein RPM1 isoform X2 [Medicago truncatula]AES95650.1 disease resistance protein (CC-NBS-LRR class) family protein [Medicago truncatula]RHN54729.1 putative P-loop containing nucleoside triphosphate hydrolase, leucine-rich repeat domain, L [Medicago truncatula]